MENESTLNLTDATKLMELCIDKAMKSVEKKMFYRKDDTIIGRLASDLFTYYLRNNVKPEDLG